MSPEINFEFNSKYLVIRKQGNKRWINVFKPIEGGKKLVFIASNIKNEKSNSK
jgi:hypothetical protein